MTLLRIFALLCCLIVPTTFAATPEVGAPLPQLDISERGEIILQGDKFGWQPWSSATNPGTVHVIQYIGAKLAHRDLYKPLTDALQEFPPGSVHVSSVINLKAALWGTSGMVSSELEKNKRQHPQATMVVDANATGVDTWALGKAGTGLVVLDAQGKVLYFSPDALSNAELASTLELIRANIAQ